MLLGFASSSTYGTKARAAVEAGDPTMLQNATTNLQQANDHMAKVNNLLAGGAGDRDLNAADRVHTRRDAPVSSRIQRLIPSVVGCDGRSLRLNTTYIGKRGHCLQRDERKKERADDGND